MIGAGSRNGGFSLARGVAVSLVCCILSPYDRATIKNTHSGRNFGFAITRYAGLIYGLTKGHVFDAEYLAMLRREVETGMRTGAPGWSNTFISAYFHHPDELKDEVEAAGLVHERTLGVIGPAWLVPNLDESWADAEKRATIMEVARMVEGESVLGPRIMVVGRKGVEDEQ